MSKRIDFFINGTHKWIWSRVGMRLSGSGLAEAAEEYIFGGVDHHAVLV